MVPIGAKKQSQFSEAQFEACFQGDDDGAPGEAPSRDTTVATSKRNLKRARVAKCPGCSRTCEKCPRWHGERESRQGKRVFDGPGCEDCYKLYVDADMDKRSDVDCSSFEKFCAAMSSGRHEAVATDFAREKEVRDDGARLQCKATNMEDATEAGWRISVDYRGYSQKQFADAFGCSASDAGYKLADLEGIDGKRYKGILMVDTEQPFTRYTRFIDQGVSRRRQEMTASTMLYEKQADYVYDHISRAHGNDGMAKRLRCCTGLGGGPEADGAHG